jgi:hypothetical protein
MSDIIEENRQFTVGSTVSEQEDGVRLESVDVVASSRNLFQAYDRMYYNEPVYSSNIVFKVKQASKPEELLPRKKVKVLDMGNVGWVIQ